LNVREWPPLLLYAHNNATICGNFALWQQSFMAPPPQFKFFELEPAKKGKADRKREFAAVRRMGIKEGQLGAKDAHYGSFGLTFPYFCAWVSRGKLVACQGLKSPR
jgi:hypothetical protein